MGELRRNRGKLLDLLVMSEDRLCIYRDLFFRYWNGFPEVGEFSGEVFAVDSSDGVVECKSGVSIHICRALGLSNSRREFRELKVSAFYSARRRNDFVVFRSRMREHVEHLVSLKCLGGYSGGSGDRVLLLDGSLYGRMAHLPRDSEISGYQGFMLDYIEVYSRFLREAREMGIPVVGVSKDSRSRILRGIILGHELERRLSLNPLGSRVEQEVLSCWSEIWKRPRNAVRRLNELSKVVSVPRWVREIFEEALVARPDVHLIMHLVREAGFTTPLLLGVPSPALDPLMYAFREGDLEAYVENNFSKALIEGGEEVFRRADRVLPLVFEYPAIFMFYYVPRKGDIPLRVDVPGWVLGCDMRVGDVEFHEVSFSEDRLLWVLSVLNGFYAGPKHYNVLLEEVDSKVKLRLRDLTNIYESVLMRELDMLIEHTRGVRRVRYP